MAEIWSTLVQLREANERSSVLGINKADTVSIPMSYLYTQNTRNMLYSLHASAQHSQLGKIYENSKLTFEVDCRRFSGLKSGFWGNGTLALNIYRLRCADEVV